MQCGRWPWGCEPHQLDVLQIQVMQEALAPLRSASGDKKNRKPPKVRKMARSVMADLARRSAEQSGEVVNEESLT